MIANIVISLFIAALMAGMLPIPYEAGGFKDRMSVFIGCFIVSALVVFAISGLVSLFI